MAATHPSAGNTFVPVFDASGKLIVEFSRKPKDFALNEYSQYRPVKKGEGYYLKITPDQQLRVQTTPGTEFDWPDSADAPSGNWNTSPFEFASYLTKRYAFPFQLGYKGVEQADWDIIASHAATVAAQAMVKRTRLAASVLLTAGNHASGHTADDVEDVIGTNAAHWGNGTASAPYIKQTFLTVAQRIHLDTAGVVGPKDMVCVIGPAVAKAMATSPEVHAYLSNSPFALGVLKDSLNFSMWGLPDSLYGIKLVVEDTPQITAKKGQTSSSAYIFGNQAAFVARPGSLVSPGGGASWSSLQFFFYEEMSVETRDDPDNRRHNGRVVEDYDVKLVAPATAYLISDVTADLAD